ncbi:MAG TPA: DUF3443 family protein [Solirubrobacteraceae bacterium]|nr:DUF3443 family protein [Solirubrobacteraceae bacterium]
MALSGRMPSRTRPPEGRAIRALLGAAVAAALAGGVLAGCGSSSATEADSRSPVGTVPVTMTTETPNGPEPAVRALVHVRVGGGPSVPVLLDTGSPGLRVLPSVVGPKSELTGRTIKAEFGGGETLVGPVARARVTVGSLSTPSPIAFQVIKGVDCPSKEPRCKPSEYLKALFRDIGAEGIMGIDTGDKFRQRVFSPLLQLGAPYSEGFSLKLAAKGSGKLILGPPPIEPGTMTAPLTRSPTPAEYPSGGLAYKRSLRMCWSASDVTSCRVTDFDIGTPTTVVSPSALLNVPTVTVSGGRIVAPGTPISIHAPGFGPVVWHYTANTSYGDGLTQISTGGGKGFNTGIVPFYSHTIGWNVRTGQIVISPK